MACPMFAMRTNIPAAKRNHPAFFNRLAVPLFASILISAFVNHYGKSRSNTAMPRGISASMKPISRCLMAGSSSANEVPIALHFTV